MYASGTSVRQSDRILYILIEVVGGGKMRGWAVGAEAAARDGMTVIQRADALHACLGRQPELLIKDLSWARVFAAWETCPVPPRSLAHS